MDGISAAASVAGVATVGVQLSKSLARRSLLRSRLHLLGLATST